MPIQVSNNFLFPDDTNALPEPGSPEQSALLNDELEIGTEAYVARLRQFSEVTDNIYPELVLATKELIAAARPNQPLRVLDLCCGVGVVSLELLAADVQIGSLTLADLSAELMRRARTLISKRQTTLPHLEEFQIDLVAEDLTARLTRTFDLVITCNAFQHFPRDRQAALVAQIHELLVPSGIFVFESHFKQLRPNWKRRLIEEYQARLRTEGAPENFVANTEHHIEHFHNYVNLYEAYNWLEAARFGVFECVFRRGEVAIFGAVK